MTNKNNLTINKVCFPTLNTHEQPPKTTYRLSMGKPLQVSTFQYQDMNVRKGEVIAKRCFLARIDSLTGSNSILDSELSYIRTTNADPYMPQIISKSG